ncbi:MAG: hypothetical protein PHT48_01925 [Dechloromonas sp.]|nr:hypothetical protein [Dechloromonas sp.]
MDGWFFAFAVSTTLMLAGGGLLLLIGYIGTLPAALSFGWRIWLPTVLLPVVGPCWFAWQQGGIFRRSLWQLLLASVLIGLASALIYHYGPYFAQQLLEEAKRAAELR